MWKIWRNFNDIADGFGLTRDDVFEVLGDSYLDMNISRSTLRDMTYALFKLLDTDVNGNYKDNKL